MNNGLTTLWGRFGITLHATAEEIDALMLDSYSKGKNVLAKIFSEGRAELDGDSYIPIDIIAEYNREHGTNYNRHEVDLDTSLLQDKKLRLDTELPEREPPKRKDRGDSR